MSTIALLTISIAALGLVVVATTVGVPLVAALLTLVTSAAMAAGGVAVLGRAVPWERSVLCRLVFGSILGLTLGRLGLVITGLVPGLREHGLILVVLLSLALIAACRGTPAPAATQEDRRETLWLTGTILVAFALIMPPFWALGRLTERGYAFVANFNTDFFHHAAITAELTRGVPPQNPLFAGETLHYYWFYHLWPAALTVLTGISARDAILLTIPITVALFIAATGLVLRLEVPDRAARFFGLGIGLFAYSYIGLLFATRLLVPAASRMVPTYFTEEYTLLSHSWYRDFLYEPQAITALTLLLFAFYLDRVSAGSAAVFVRLLMGAALGLTVGTDTVIALIGVGCFGLVALWRLARGRDDLPHVLLPFAAAAGLVVGALALGMLPMPSSAAKSVTFWVHPIATFGPLYLLVELGPLFLFGIAGLGMLVVGGRARLRAGVLLLAGMSMLCAFFVTVPLEPNHSLRKGLKVLELALVVLAADAWLLYAVRWRPRWLSAALMVALVGGVVTLATDVFQYVDVTHKKPQPTTYLSADEMQVLDWIRISTPPEAVFQMLSEVQPGQKFRDTFGSLISTFGERRTLVGDAKAPQLFAVPPAKIAARRDQLERLFTAQDADTAQRILEQVRPDYLYVDDRGPGPTGAVRQLTMLGVLTEAYRVNNVHVLKLTSQGLQ